MLLLSFRLSPEPFVSKSFCSFRAPPVMRGGGAGEDSKGCLRHRGPCTSPLSQFMIDASDPTRLSASCAHLLGLLSAPPLAEASVLILFNKMYGV